MKMATKSEIEYQILELKSDYIRQQGDIEKLESTGFPQMIIKAEERLKDMEAQLAALNEELAKF